MRSTWCSLGAVMTKRRDPLPEPSAAELEADASYYDARYRTRIRYKYRARFLSPSDKMRRAAHLLDQLAELEAATDPIHGDATAKSKNYKAREALRIAGKLIDVVAGWAVHHQIGMAAEGQQPLPDVSWLLSENEAYRSAKAQLDQHRHEAIGSEITRSGFDMPPAQTRQAISNVLRPMSRTSNSTRGLFATTATAMDDLSRGAAPALVDQEKPRGTTVSSRIMELKILAFGFVEYRIARGIPANTARTDVAKAYKMSADNIRNWQREIVSDKNTNDYIRMIDEIAYAKYGGTLYKEFEGTECPRDLGFARDGIAQRYSDERLELAGREYKNKPATERSARG